MIKFINSRRNKKGGFSLVEVIVALAIFALFSLVIAVMFELVFKLHMNTDSINKQMTQQTPVLDNSTGVDYTNGGTNAANAEFKILFADDTLSFAAEKGEKVANSAANDYTIPIRVFSYK